MVELSFDSYQMRLIQQADFENYFHFGFESVSESTRYFTGTTDVFSRDQVKAYIDKTLDDQSRFHFLIIEQSDIIGEAVLTDITEQNGHFRIAIFDENNHHRGIGRQASKRLIDFAREELKLETIELEVFPFNFSAIALYEKLGFEEVERFHDSEAQAPFDVFILMRLRIALAPKSQ